MHKWYIVVSRAMSAVALPQASAEHQNAIQAPTRQARAFPHLASRIQVKHAKTFFLLMLIFNPDHNQ